MKTDGVDRQPSRGSGKKVFEIRPDVIFLRVKAKPGAREDRVRGSRGGELLVSVRAVPEKGKANDELARILSRYLGVPRSEVVLKRGAGSPHKVFEVPLSTMRTLEELEEME